jgi:hypothetical protein
MPHHGSAYFAKLAFGIVLVLVILGLLQAAPKQYRRGIIAVFTFLGGLFYFLEFFWPVKRGQSGNFLTPYQDFVANLSAVIGAYAIGLGVVSLVQFHSRNITRRREGWGNSVALLLAALAMAVFTIRDQYWGKEVLFHDPITGHPQNNHGVFLVLFNGGLNSLDAATFSLIAFFIASASYRAFRIRSVESSLLMTAALIVMLASTTLGTAITQHVPAQGWEANFRIENISQWLLTRLNAPAQRGIVFGLEVGALATSLRLWLSLERGAYFDAEV